MGAIFSSLVQLPWTVVAVLLLLLSCCLSTIKVTTVWALMVPATALSLVSRFIGGILVYLVLRLSNREVLYATVPGRKVADLVDICGHS